MPFSKPRLAALKYRVTRILIQVSHALRRKIVVANPEQASAAQNGLQQVGTVEPAFPNARMSFNRLRALDGAGYRECYMDKLRAVSRGNAGVNTNRHYWFDAFKHPFRLLKLQKILMGQSAYAV